MIHGACHCGTITFDAEVLLGVIFGTLTNARNWSGIVAHVSGASPAYMLRAQSGGVSQWFLWPLFPLFLVYWIAGVAETNRAPFDVAEGEFATQASNVLALAPRLGLMLDANPRTRRRLAA